MNKLYKDFLFFPDISILIVLILSGVGTSLFMGVTWYMFLLFIIGMVTFAFSEYFTHRFFFHIKAPKNPLFLRFMKRIHYDHHTDPNNLKLLFLPLWYSLPGFFVLSYLFYLVSNSFNLTIAFGTGLMTMLLVYEWKHYVAHRPIKPKTKFGRWVKKVHILHHYKNENFWYGVSTPLADFLFGTFKDEKNVETSRTAKALGKRM
ncbi:MULTISPECIES: sterol desaturase family protein [Mesobacillus]|uniref:sterol desaturase family protein n=1 Tax=Mesobacillus TaxID=2675231 RepID=UPI00177A93E3|nr:MULTISPECIES: sterol desaturase family protein [Mesobacillus]MCM3573077.1 sterol desaturase family protein [Mesobacillus subterraneus]UYZ23321.1 sterol desaturase family protein [Mesobacillus jeotgali]